MGRQRVSVRWLVALIALALVACSSSGALPAGGDAPAPDAPAAAGLAAPSGVGTSAAAAAGMLPALLSAPRLAPADQLAALAALLEPSGPPYKTGPNKDSPVITPPFALPSGDGTVYAVGDSVLLGTEDYLPTTIGGWDLRLDARVSRTMPEGLSIIDENRASIGQAMIICLGHNYGGGGKFLGYLDQLMGMVRRAQRVIVMTVAEWSPAQVEVNRAVRSLPASYPNVIVADWQAVIAANPQFLRSDRVHLTRSGNIALANLLAVLLGPARPNGRAVPPPKILPIPDEPGGPTVPSTTTTSGSTTTTSPSTTIATTTTAPTSTTTTVLTTTTSR